MYMNILGIRPASFGWNIIEKKNVYVLVFNPHFLDVSQTIQVNNVRRHLWHDGELAWIYDVFHVESDSVGLNRKKH